MWERYGLCAEKPSPENDNFPLLRLVYLAMTTVYLRATRDDTRLGALYRTHRTGKHMPKCQLRRLKTTENRPFSVRGSTCTEGETALWKNIQSDGSMSIRRVSDVNNYDNIEATNLLATGLYKNTLV